MHVNEDKYAYATLILRGPRFDPQEISNALGLYPSMSFKHGDQRNEVDTWKNSFWSLSSQNQVSSNSLLSHLDWLGDQIGSIKPRLMEVLRNKDIKAEISCFWIMPSDHENLSLNPFMMGMLAELGISLNMDIYTP